MSISYMHHMLVRWAGSQWPNRQTFRIHNDCWMFLSTSENQNKRKVFLVGCITLGIQWNRSNRNWPEIKKYLRHKSQSIWVFSVQKVTLSACFRCILVSYDPRKCNEKSLTGKVSISSGMCICIFQDSGSNLAYQILSSHPKVSSRLPSLC